MTNAWQNILDDLKKAVMRFSEILAVPETANDYVKDATIQRFEFCVELFWKVFKKISEAQGYEVNSPKAALRKAYALELINDEQLWLSMMNDRNLTSHTYRELLASEIYQRVKTYLPAMQAAVKTVENYNQ